MRAGTSIPWESTVPYRTARAPSATLWRRSDGTSSSGPAETLELAPIAVVASTARNAPAAGVPEASEEFVRRSSALLSSPCAPSRLGSTLASSRSRSAAPDSIWFCASSSLACRMLPAIWVWMTKPSTRTTAVDSANVLITTRSWSERRHTAPHATASSMPSWRTCSMVRRITMASRGPGFVPHPAHGQHDLRVLRVALDLRPQPLDVHVHQPRVGRVAVSPHLLAQHLPSEHLARLAGQCHEQVELQRREGDRLARPRDLVRRDVDRDVADRQLLGRLGLGAPHPGADAGDELLGLERLDDVVVGARLQAEDDVDGVALSREHHDRHARLGADGPADVDAVHAGEHEVQQHDIGPQLTHGGQRTGAVADHGGVETL